MKRSLEAITFVYPTPVFVAMIPKCGNLSRRLRRPILARLRRAMELVRGRTLPQGLLGQAIDYTLKRWEALTRFVADGTLEIDNNLIENAIRPSGLGKKLVVRGGISEAGKRSTVIYTLLGSWLLDNQCLHTYD